MHCGLIPRKLTPGVESAAARAWTEGMRFITVILSLGLAAAFSPAGVITFTDVSVQAGIATAEDGSNCTLADVDRDCDLDIMVWNTSGFDDQLFLNDGSASFEEVAEAYQISGQFGISFEWGGGRGL